MKLKTISLSIFILYFWTAAWGIGVYMKKEVQELKIRDGLSSFISRALKGDSLKVAYLGGSITAQNGWRVYSMEWFKERFPQAAFTQINAAIGGTGSDFGVFRLHDQVLAFLPDLVFVEFAVNDGSMSKENITRSMEGIVRQIWQADPKTDICFIYTIKENFIETEQQGNLPVSAQTMEQIASHYHIPSINFGKEVCTRVAEHRLIFRGKEKEQDGTPVFSPDGTHPYPETGHLIYQSVLKRSFEKMVSNIRKGKLRAHKMLAPLDSDCFSKARMLDVSSSGLSKNQEILQVKDHPFLTGFGRYLESVEKVIPGEALTVRFKGTKIGAYDMMGPGAGRVQVNVDGEVKDTIYRFDAYCTYWRMNYFLIDHLEDNDHVAVFKVIPGSFDKATILKKNGNTMKDPGEYIENNWYVGKILIDGEPRTD